MPSPGRRNDRFLAMWPAAVDPLQSFVQRNPRFKSGQSRCPKNAARRKLAMLSDEPERNWDRKAKKHEHLDQHEHHFGHQIAPISASN